MTHPIVLGGMVIAIAGLVFLSSIVQLVRLRYDEPHLTQRRRKVMRRREPRTASEALWEWSRRWFRAPGVSAHRRIVRTR